jgi:hypothetical protein
MIGVLGMEFCVSGGSFGSLYCVGGGGGRRPQGQGLKTERIMMDMT